MQNYFSTNIKFIREQKGLTQEQMANLFNKDYSTVGKWESGIRSPIMEDALKISEILHVPIEDLFGRDLRNKNNDKKVVNFGDIEVTLSKNGKITDKDMLELNQFLIKEKILSDGNKNEK